MNPNEYADAITRNFHESAKQQALLNRGNISAQKLSDEKADKDPQVQAYQEIREQRKISAEFSEPFVTREQFSELLDAISNDQKRAQETIDALTKRVEALESNQKTSRKLKGDKELVEA